MLEQVTLKVEVGATCQKHAGNLQKLGKARKQILPCSLQKEHSLTDHPPLFLSLKNVAIYGHLKERRQNNMSERNIWEYRLADCQEPTNPL